MSNLLAIDWDFFFPNPLEGGFESDGTLLYDWGHRETVFFIEHIWPTRAMGFVGNNRPLPVMDDRWRKFLDRFQFTDDVRAYVSESNMLAGSLSAPDGDPFESVWLFDAHHDSGYTHSTLRKFRDAETYSCEDWMLQHYMMGSDLHVRFPRWKENWHRERPSAKEVVVDMKQDDDERLTGLVFDTVHLCRSGAWVPPWEDAKFFQFMETLPGDVEELGGYDLKPRRFDMSDVTTLLD